jgi:hypothetical protein
MLAVGLADGLGVVEEQTPEHADLPLEAESARPKNLAGRHWDYLPISFNESGR